MKCACAIITTVFFHGTTFEKTLLNTTFLFCFAPHRRYENILILRRTARDMIETRYIGLHVKYPLFLSDFN
jgi:hypothetical protein